ncbi:ATP-binding cassette domain-containing protein [Myxococcota bacterium]|nr:ATP-binding cassette domain-containing protein [Myxococcota bacterium]MBU1533797.1 ATP-binding cassette domain-containing protein [Myxococcota bacterium]
MITIQNLSKTFSQREPLFSGASLTIAPHTVTVITGPSGSGKTTLLRMIRGEEPYDSGRILLDRKEVSRLNSRSLMMLRRDMGMVCQENNLLAERSVLENIALPLRIKGIHGALLRTRVEKMIELFKLEKVAFTACGVISGGEKRKVSMARAMSVAPGILLADEPSAGLDPLQTLELITILFALPLEEGTTLIVATHNPTLLEGLGVHGTYRIRDGQLQGDDCHVELPSEMERFTL